MRLRFGFMICFGAILMLSLQKKLDMRVHFIAIGGSAMHNLAIALHRKGDVVSGSDDEIFEPSKSRLAACGLLPPEIGWFPEKITPDLDAIILGMHARADNPELIAAQKLGLKIYSYPEYLYEQSKTKKRIVIGGSHGKTTITSMILHILKYAGIEADYMVGAQLDGFDVMVRLSNGAEWMIMEGDEYLTSPLDRRPKFLHYRPNIALISGIGWDHVNVFPKFDMYLDQFRQFIRAIELGGSLIYNADDDEVVRLAQEASCHKIPYSIHPFSLENGDVFLQTPDGQAVKLQIFGRHNLTNISAALAVTNVMGVSSLQAYKALTDFKGASRRLELVLNSHGLAVYRDFAHAPSKVKASCEAMRQKYPDHQLIACFEPHTFSSLNSGFIGQYRDALEKADIAVVFYDPHAVELKKLTFMDADTIREAFNHPHMVIVSDTSGLIEVLKRECRLPSAIVMMSSGSFGGLDIRQMAEEILQ